MTRTLNYVIVTSFSKVKLMRIVKLIASDFPVVRINEVLIKAVILNEVFE